MKNRKQIIILDLGSQYTLVIARVITGLGVQCMVLKPEDLQDLEGVKGIILSGSNYSVDDPNSPHIPEIIFESNLPILGICYGMQYMAYREDKNSVWSSPGKKEYGPVGIEFNEPRSLLFENLPNTLMVYASHGDSVHSCHSDYRITSDAMSISGIQSIEHRTKPWYGVQFHPEVDDTKDDNQILKNFVFTICKAKVDWDVKSSINLIVQSTLLEIGNGKAVLGVSGGVDSTTLAAILGPVLKDKLHCVLIDHGGMREGEVEDVKRVCEELNINLNVVEASEKFIYALQGLKDSERKRKSFQYTYKAIFKAEIFKSRATHIIQGTLATDLIESGHAGKSAKIKTHHNVGLDFHVEEISPFKNLFKHEVRDIARSLKLPFAERQPFPGPGLFIRIVGVEISKQNLEKLRKADHIVTNILKDENLYDNISQLVVGLMGIDTVGIQGDERTYNNPICIHAVQTLDFMTSSAVFFSKEVKQRIMAEVIGYGLTNRVWFDENSKPPATTEFE